jgi:hypothetical protein
VHTATKQAVKTERPGAGSACSAMARKYVRDRPNTQTFRGACQTCQVAQRPRFVTRHGSK